MGPRVVTVDPNRRHRILETDREIDSTSCPVQFFIPATNFMRRKFGRGHSGIYNMHAVSMHYKNIILPISVHFVLANGKKLVAFKMVSVQSMLSRKSVDSNQL